MAVYILIDRLGRVRTVDTNKKKEGKRDAKKCCDTCYHWVMTRGLFPHLRCLQAEETPEYIEERLKVNGVDCSYWVPKTRILKVGRG